MVPMEPSPMRRMLTPAESVRAWGCEMSMVGLGGGGGWTRRKAKARLRSRWSHPNDLVPAAAN